MIPALNSVLPLLSWILSALAAVILTGCATSDYEGTPVVAKHAKRAYNKPYEIKGQWYSPQPVYEYCEEGIASYYGGRDVFHRRPTSTGERFDKNRLTAAHKTLPLPCVVRVTNLENGRSIKVHINDHGPFIEGRIIDVSEKAAKLLGFYQKGTARVLVESLVPESIYLAQNYNPKAPPAFSLPHEKPRILAHHNPRPKAYPLPKKGPLDLRPSPALQAPLYYVKASTHPTQHQAELFKRQLAHRYKMPAGVYQKKYQKQLMYQVCVGPLKNPHAAQLLMHKMKKNGLPQAQLLQDRKPRLQ
jgi:rare lipoprotein A